MLKPTLNEIASSRDFIEAFTGYNHNLRINDGEFYDMKNLTSSFYPVLAPRSKRGVYCEPLGIPLAMIEKDALCYVELQDSHLYFCMDEYRYDLGFTAIDETVQRNLVSMGAYVVIMPDKMYINTADTEDRGNIEASFETAEGETVTFRLCKADGTEYAVNLISTTEPSENLTNGYLWLDTSVTPNSLKQYSAANGVWSSVATTYIKISYPNIGKAFKDYDGVKISGIKIAALEDLNSTMVLYARGDDYLVVVGILDDSQGVTQTEKITVERRMPQMDFIIESNNRLWGCRYGLNNDGDIVNELYACKLGDFKNWNCFMGISTDSYYVSLGTDGQFTGAITYLGYPLFFKDNCVHTVYGNYPAEYQVQDTACRGVQKGSEKSLAMVNEVLYYKSRTGVCAYSGSLPVEISAVFGEKAYSSAVACGHKNKYYITMKDSQTGEFTLFVYDTAKGFWHKEDELETDGFCSRDEEIYYIDSDDKQIKTIFGSGTKDTAPVRWMAETGILGCSTPDKKYISRLSVRLQAEVGARIKVLAMYDSSGVWEQLASMTSNTLRSFTFPVRPKRCDHLKIRIEGSGDVRIYSISKTLESGSDI